VPGGALVPRRCCSSWIYWITPVHYAFGTLMIGEVYRNIEYADTGRYAAWPGGARPTQRVR